MLERDGQLAGRALGRIGLPVAQNVLHLGYLLQGMWRVDRFRRFRQRQIVDETEAIALPHRSDFVFAIRIESREVGAEAAVPGAGEIDRLFFPLVPDDEFASLVRGRKPDHKGCDHAVEFFAIAVWQEEASLFVKEQIVEMRLQFLFLEAQLFLHASDGSLQKPRPFRISQPESVRHDLPNASDVGVDDGLLPLAVGRLLAVLFDLFRLPNGKGQTNRSDLVNFQAGQRRGDAALRTERAGTVDFAERLEKSLGNRCGSHGSLLDQKPTWCVLWSPHDG